MTPRVYAIRYAHRADARRGEHFLFRPADSADLMPIDYYLWLIQDDDRTVLVDAAFTEETAARRGRKMTCDPLDVLRRLGVEPSSVDDLVLTHLHYDHTGYVAAFQNARIWLQQKEIHFWTQPHAARRGFREVVEADDIQYVVKGILYGQVKLIDGDAFITDDISVHLVGGHTAGTQVVRVRTPGGPVVLASDACHFYENIDDQNPYALADSVPGMYTAFEKLISFVDDPADIIAGHDPLVLERYPAAAPDLAGTVVIITAQRSIRE